MEDTKREWKVTSAKFTDKGVSYEVIMPKQEICIATAHLIAAAPTMYEALKEAEQHLIMAGVKPDSYARRNIEQVLAKAEGGK